MSVLPSNIPASVSNLTGLANPSAAIPGIYSNVLAEFAPNVGVGPQALALQPPPTRQASLMCVIPNSAVKHMSSIDTGCTCFVYQGFNTKMQALMLGYTQLILQEPPIYG